MIKYSLFICIVLCTQTSIVFATPGTPYIITRVDNPDHYDTLARNHDVFKEAFNNWEITSVSKPLKQNKIVIFYVNLLVPDEIAPMGVSYEFGVWLKFSADSLINYNDIKAVRLQLKEVINHIESHKYVRTFRDNVDVSSEYLYWNGGYIFEIRSKQGDTLVTSTRWPSREEGGHVWKFSFTHPHLLDVLEIFLNNLYPLPHILTFRDRLGIGHASKKGSILQISSGSNCDGTDACMMAYHSFQLITAYKLPLNLDWSNFPYITDAVREFKYFTLTQGKSDCFSSYLPPHATFAIMCHQQNTLPRRIYFPIKCKNNLSKIVSVQVDSEGSKTPDPIIHDASILDSLLTELKWDD